MKIRRDLFFISKYEQTLNDLGAEILESLRFPDHHEYTIKEMHDVLQHAENQEAECIVITEKDAVKIPRDVAEANWKIQIYVICVEVTFKIGAEEFRNELQSKISEKIGH